MNFSVPGFQLVDSAGNPVLIGDQRALLLYNGGTVCYDNDTVFTHTSAHAICKLMGFEGETMAGFTRLFSRESYSPKLANVKCSSNLWSSCSYTTNVTNVMCRHDGDVFLACSICPPGFDFHRGSRSCRPCRPGTYKDENTTSCTACPIGSTSTLHSDYCHCQAGQFWDGNDCKHCSSGFVSEAGSHRCSACPSGFVSEAGSLRCSACPSGSSPLEGRSKCSCPAGYIWDTKTNKTGTCEPCSPGSYKKDSQSRSCKMCPGGTTSDVGSEHCICPPGHYWDGSACETCSLGSASRQGALDCFNCPLGSQAEEKNTSCSCHWGKEWFWDKDGRGSCVWVIPSATNVLLLVLLAAFMVISFLLMSCLMIKARKRHVTPQVRVTYTADRGVDVVDTREVVSADEEATYTDEDAYAYAYTFTNEKATHANEEATYANEEATFTEEEATYANEEATFTEEEATYANEEATFTEEEATYANEEATFADEEVTYANEEAIYVDMNNVTGF